ncbi:MAG: dihydrolipoyl dehydrogenase [Proteobacteria bacterium]|nr:dihydrolipoyl dehydrogenase [Pseudomonadota bacterium]
MPELGDFSDVEVIEVLVEPGDEVAIEESLITLETDKASMDVPSTHAGKVSALKVKVGDKVNAGDVILTLDATELVESESTVVLDVEVQKAILAAATPTAEVLRQPRAGETHSAQLVVIGSGPGGYTAAFRAADLGLAVILVERYPVLGGVCLNVGCIPSKTLLHASELYEDAKTKFPKMGIVTQGVAVDLAAMMAHKNKVVGELTKGVEFLFKKNKVEGIVGAATISAPGKVSVKTKEALRELSAKHIVIATGSDVAPLPGITIDEKTIVSSTGALALSEVPGRLLVVGAGVIGLEMGSVWRRLGSEVKVVEFLDRIVPGVDAEVAKQFQRLLERQGMSFTLSSKVVGVEKKGGELIVAIEPASGGKPQFVNADVMLVATGRRPYTDGLGLDQAGVTRDKQGRIVTDGDFRTSVDTIWAIGDVREGAMLAHKAEDEAVAVAEIIAGRAGHVNYDAIASVIYTYPEVATVGKTEEEVKEAGIAYRVGKFPFAANARAKSNLTTEGFVKIIADAKTDRVLGVHMIGPDVGNMIGEASLALEFSAASEDIARTSHAHPTLAEAIRQAAMGVTGWTMQM